MGEVCMAAASGQEQLPRDDSEYFVDIFEQ